MLTIAFQNDRTGEVVDGADGEPFQLIGNYDVTVKVNAEIVWQGRVENHIRLSGWQGLVACFMRQISKAKVKP